MSVYQVRVGVALDGMIVISSLLHDEALTLTLKATMDKPWITCTVELLTTWGGVSYQPGWKLSTCGISYRLLLQSPLWTIPYCTFVFGWHSAWRSSKSSFVMVKLNLDDCVDPNSLRNTSPVHLSVQQNTAFTNSYSNVRVICLITQRRTFELRGR